MHGSPDTHARGSSTTDIQLPPCRPIQAIVRAPGVNRNRPAKALSSRAPIGTLGKAPTETPGRPRLSLDPLDPARQSRALPRPARPDWLLAALRHVPCWARPTLDRLHMDGEVHAAAVISSLALHREVRRSPAERPCGDGRRQSAQALNRGVPFVQRVVRSAAGRTAQCTRFARRFPAMMHWLGSIVCAAGPEGGPRAPADAPERTRAVAFSVAFFLCVGLPGHPERPGCSPYLVAHPVRPRGWRFLPLALHDLHDRRPDIDFPEILRLDRTVRRRVRPC